MTLSPELTTGLVAICSAFVGALPSLISNYLSRKADDKKHMRELIMKIAAENWRFIADNSEAIYPFEHYMIHTALMCDLAFSDKPITENRVNEHIAMVDLVMKSLSEHALLASKIKSQ